MPSARGDRVAHLAQPSYRLHLRQRSHGWSHGGERDLLEDFSMTKPRSRISAAAGVALALLALPLRAQPADTATIRPFHFHASDEQLADLQRRIQATRWPDKELVADDSQGVRLATMQALAKYWGSAYDWKKAEKRLDSYPQFVTTIDGVDIHFIHVRSKDKNAL